ncbi:MAG TPA: amino acid-binding protein [Spirochaetota bacterium]|nr:amino acid-binding protein [Spirochaetota bacterium]OPZ39695.1 MAG: ACT domain protein [Spirochaetes bacterium ADurb.BinA120]HNU92585.1 amino acid-binding protein [Spirochaetota bacterium]HPI15105.1 amino acid-binding protein [Spirochaetota bacterium]HPO46981.1 amino acid-binding protein [Spirochaetota bacterium]
MPITQVSVSVENSPGKLNEICDILEKEQINIKAIMASVVMNPVQVHMIVSDPSRAETVLRASGLNVTTREVIAVATPDHPGGLNAVLRPLIESRVNVETLYPFINLRGDEAIIIIEVDKIDEAKAVLKKHWVKTFESEIYKS